MTHQHIRSFHPRRSRTTPRALSALNRLLPAFAVDPADPPPYLGQLFDPPLPVVLEIGSGMGEATWQLAQDQPETGIVAVDVHTPGIGALLARVEDVGLPNVRVCIGDAVELLRLLAPASLAGIRVFFPDPWQKVRHHKRRLVQPAFVHRASELLIPGGTLHLATDWTDYAAAMLAAVAAEPLLGAAPDYSPRPDWRPVTKFEARALAAGRQVREILAVRL